METKTKPSTNKVWNLGFEYTEEGSSSDEESEVKSKHKQHTARISKKKRRWLSQSIVHDDNVPNRTTEPIRLIYDDVTYPQNDETLAKLRQEWVDLYSRQSRVKVRHDMRKLNNPAANRPYLREARPFAASEYFRRPTSERSIFVFFVYLHIRQFLPDQGTVIDIEGYHKFAQRVNDSCRPNLTCDVRGLRAQLVVQVIVYSDNAADTDAFLLHLATLNAQSSDEGEPQNGVFHDIMERLAAFLPTDMSFAPGENELDAEERGPADDYYLCLPGTCIRPQFYDVRLFGDMSMFNRDVNVPFYGVINGEEYPAADLSKAGDSAITAYKMILQHGILDATKGSHNAFAEFLANDPRLINQYIAAFLGVKTDPVYRFH